MVLDISPEDKAVGKDNFHRAVGGLANAQIEERSADGRVTRRQFMHGLVAAGAIAPVAAGAYFGYSNERWSEGPVRAALIGAGDEGGVLVGEHNPAYLKFVAYSDIRPSNQRRIFEDEKATNPNSPRRGFKHHYGNNCDNRSSPDYIRLFENYRDLLADTSLRIEAVVVALPLHLHAPVVIDCLEAGKHVLCEKLMAWNITQCKEMIHKAGEKDKLLAIGHQRHYSMLYAHALDVMRSGVLGDVRHIRALWHRNNARPLMANGREVLDAETGQTKYRDSWRPQIKEIDRRLTAEELRRAGFRNLNELVRWRLYNRTGGGLMAELGSHQLDACSIFLRKVRPIAVSGFGDKIFYKDDREVEDHVFCTFEFPGPNYWTDPAQPGQVRDRHDKVIVTYSSISTNDFEKYGECVMGSKATLVVEQEQTAMLFPPGTGRGTAMSVTMTGGGAAVVDSSSSTSDAGSRRTAQRGETALGMEAPSRGYREEMEHFAYLIRTRDQASEAERRELKPRCDGQAAMGDAIMALTANLAMRRGERIPFQPLWYDATSSEVPDAEMRPQGV